MQAVGGQPPAAVAALAVGVGALRAHVANLEVADAEWLYICLCICSFKEAKIEF